ncbi:alpha-L-rhamnosidase [Cellulomonas soli]|uniref:glycoside hydrolase family 78 protein n=1 Tax=Cellulomonas soli TaxID=931535 RepID=UPI0017E3C51A|nr:glycoside hydrolase family 78 protein [Cellulomonas soli]NYI60248.1 alpha-L-rhamnosidase [Cellulomonas soli]
MLYSAAHGVYQAQVNGHDVDDSVLKPGWTSYQYRTVHDAVDVTDSLHAGRNAIGIRLAGGWWTERYGFGDGATRFYGGPPGVAAHLHVTFEDGTSQVLRTGSGWRSTTRGALRTSGIYAGETWDARQQLPGWSRPGFDDSDWSPARVDGPFETPEPAISEPVRRTELLPVRVVLRSAAGRVLLDFGQNLVGRLRLTVSGPEGHVLRVRHAEVLEDGELATRPLRRASATDEYALAGDGPATLEPEFTFHGFRYAEIEGWPGVFDPDCVQAVVLGSDMRRTGWFETSDPLVNRLHENVVWGMRGNFLSIPMDCPQRDERLGWTGDIQAFGPTAAFLYDCDAFLASWLRDVAREQAAHGGVCPTVVPSVLGPAAPVAGWSDAATVVPDVLHARFGDRAALAEQYPSMCAWVEALLGITGDRLLWEGMFQFGDWLDPVAPPEHPEDGRTDPDLVASAQMIRSLTLVAQAAATLDHEDDRARYAALAERARAAFRAEFVTPAGRMMSDSPTAYALALQLDIVTSAEQRTALARRLLELVRAGGYRMPTGFIGTPLIMDALVDSGAVAAAQRLLLQTENPSWLYAVTMGATTIWERWDSLLEDGSLNPGDMTSFNHYASGAVADWLHRRLAGLAPAAPGYRRLRIAPVPLDGLEFATATLDTRYGRAQSGWRRDGDHIVVQAVVPANTTAQVLLPGSTEAIEVGSGVHEWTTRAPSIARPDAPLTPSTPLSTVIDRPGAYEALLAAAHTVGPDSSARVRQRTRWVPQRSLASVLAEVGISDAIIPQLNRRLEEQA